MSYNPTENQKSIIYEKSKGIIVSASAGSGKTSTMIARITNLIKSKKVDIKRLLILTFTNAAASDMREKLIVNLQQIISEKELDLNALFQISSSNISTIDSFCQTLVRRYCYEVGVDPNFNVLDDTAKTLLMENAFNSLLIDLWLKKDKNTLSLINVFSENRNLNDLKNAVFNLYNSFCVMENYYNLLDNTKLSFNKNLKDNLSANYYVKYVNFVVDDFCELIDRLIPNLFCDEVIKFVESVRSQVLSLHCNNFVELVEKAKLINFKAKPSFRKDEVKQQESDFAASQINEHLSDIKDIVKFVKDNSSYNSDVLESAYTQANNIFKLTEQFKNKYYELKQTRYALDFSDIEELAFKILSNTKIRQEVVSEFDYVFVDEYQDVNLMQAKLLENLSKNDIFAVGDAKQSIYGFRLTSPEIFMNSFNMALKQNGKIKAKILSENFRSSNEILNFVNFVFEKIMTKKTSQMEYDNNAKFVVNSNTKKVNLPVNVCIVKKSKDKPNLQKIYSVKNDKNTLMQKTGQAEVVANIIHECLLKGYSEGDIVLLCRNRSKEVLNIYKKLVEIGFKINMNFEFDVKSTLETTLINNFLYLISNYKNDIYLYSVLKDFYNLTPNDFVEIKGCFCDKKYFYEAVEQFIELNKSSPNERNLTIAQTLIKMFDDLKNLILFSENNNVYKVANKVVEMFGLKAKLSGDANVNLSNIQKFLNELKRLDLSVNEYASLTLNTSYKVKSTNEKNNITLTTIHASKGLEYKVVILIDAAKEFNFSDVTKRVLVDNVLGISLKGVNVEDEITTNTLPKVSAEKLKKEKLFSDELRLLYVALTRAQSELFVVGEMLISKKADSEYQIKKCNNYMSLILAALPLSKFNELVENGTTMVAINNICFANFSYIDFPQSALKPNPYILPKSNPDDEKQLLSCFKQQLVKNSPQVFKNTVTRILENENEKKYFETLSFGEDEKIESILRGNAYHKFFELFNAKADNLEEEKQQVLDKLTSTERELINEEYINNYINSEVIKIMQQGEVLKEQKFVYKDLSKNITGTGSDIILLQGIIDCLVIENNEFTIIDYKTSHASDKALVDRYAAQLRLYSLAISKILKKKAKKVYLYSVFNSKLIEVCE